MKMKAVTLWQPWASLVAIGAKPDETRSWKAPCTLHQGDLLAIHAGRRSGWGMMEAVELDATHDAFLRAGVDLGNCLPSGAVLAVCEFIACHRAEDRARHLTERQRLFGDYSPGRYAWELRPLYRLPEPIPARGRQGLWEWEATDDVCDYLRDIACAEGDFWEEVRSAGERL